MFGVSWPYLLVRNKFKKHTRDTFLALCNIIGKMINNETFIYLQDVFWVIFHLDGSDTNYLILVTIKSDYVFKYAYGHFYISLLLF